LGPNGKHEALGRLPAGDRSIPAAHVQARRSMIFADAAAVHGEQSLQGAIFDVDGVRPASISALRSVGGSANRSEMNSTPPPNSRQLALCEPGLSATIPLTATEAMFARWVRRPHHPVG
jgi:hypothetical protein